MCSVSVVLQANPVTRVWISLAQRLHQGLLTELVGSREKLLSALMPAFGFVHVFFNLHFEQP